MITVRDAILGLTGYPVPMRTIELICAKRGLSAEEEASNPILSTQDFRLVEADIYMWLYGAPNVSQGGQSYSLSSDQRAEFKRKARAIYAEYGCANDMKGDIKYGYKGSRL